MVRTIEQCIGRKGAEFTERDGSVRQDLDDSRGARGETDEQVSIGENAFGHDMFAGVGGVGGCQIRFELQGPASQPTNRMTLSRSSYLIAWEGVSTIFGRTNARPERGIGAVVSGLQP